MKKLFLLMMFFFVPTAHAWPRLGQGATPVFNNTGKSAYGISVTVGNVTPVLVYSGLDNDREILLQNTSATYKIYLSTSPNVTAASGPRVMLRANQDFTTDNSVNIYAIAESGGSAEVTGWVEYDPKDR